MNYSRKFGIWAIFVVVVALFALIVLAINGPAIQRKFLGAAVIEVPLTAGPQDAEFAQFTLCHGPVRANCVVDGDTIWYQQKKSVSPILTRRKPASRNAMPKWIWVKKPRIGCWLCSIRANFRWCLCLIEMLINMADYCEKSHAAGRVSVRFWWAKAWPNAG